ncbi:Sensor protein of zinc sigma-54-dependent two-component system [Candidatus Sumerlaea chitinivorans]|jgi:signal transduction histidine kinase|uniref:histidine kinase n=1 Tax=Sumerlaea chitinivorans TaxID=2250252 RepID=A0A2Z4Y641_SUMC1|nr:Sensor protein of zinc sigma-54-dependent two-component system [Candidatus Sumerlaea chitinivorans]
MGFMPLRKKMPDCGSTTQQLNQRMLQLQALYRIAVATASTMKPTEIMRLVLDEVVRWTEAVAAVVYFYDQQRDRLVPRLTYGRAIESSLLPAQEEDGLVTEVAHHGKLTQTPFVLRPARAKQQRFWRITIPLVSGDETTGVIDLVAERSKRFEPETEEFLSTLASQAAQVLRNALIYEELEQHYREISLLYEIQQEIASTLDYNSVLQLIVHRTKQIMNASECTIRLLVEHDGKPYIRVVASSGKDFIGPEEVPLEESQVDQPVIGGEMIYIEDVRTDPKFRWREEAKRAGVVSMVCAPLVARRRTIGTIRLYTAERREFDLSERKILSAIAGQAAQAIENARLYHTIEEQNRQLLRSYEELRNTQKELLRKERLAALGEMAATVAHEIRNPLTSIRGFAQRIQRRYAHVADERLAEYTGIIMEEVDRLNKFIKDVLDFARHAKPNFERTNLNTVIADVLALLRDDFARKEITILPDLAPNLQETVCDRMQMRQAFINLLQNARQAVSRGGMILIRTQNLNGYVRVRIADNGCGIPRDILQKIWSPFFTTKTHGTGLGLALVQRIVDDHHGRITIRSKEGRGTIVTLLFPVVENEDRLLSRTADSSDSSS